MLQHTKCRKIGTSYGAIIPSNLLKSAKINVHDELEINYIESDNVIVIRKSTHSPRAGWAESFKLLSDSSGDELLIADVFEDEFTDESI